MHSSTDRINEKLHTLSARQIQEVERFIESLQEWHGGREDVATAAAISAPAFEKVWSNPEDEAYDAL